MERGKKSGREYKGKWREKKVFMASYISAKMLLVFAICCGGTMMARYFSPAGSVTTHAWPKEAFM
jgi:hypothetical protein